MIICDTLTYIYSVKPIKFGHLKVVKLWLKLTEPIALGHLVFKLTYSSET